MAFGFVYLLANRAMPCYYKIGCTERSPHARAKELAASSGVPHAFDVLLFIEVDDFQAVERRMHIELSDFRANGGREFFCFGPAHMNWVWHVFKNYPRALSFTAPKWQRYADPPWSPDDYEETWIGEGDYLHMPSTPPLDGQSLTLVAS